MKKVCSLILATLLVMSLSACSSAKLSDDYSEEKVIARAKEVVEVINTLDYSAMNAELRDDLEESLTAEDLEKAWGTSLSKASTFVEYKTVATAGKKSKSTGEDYATVVLVCKYEKSSLTYTIVMDKNMDIVGMYMK